MHTYSDEQKLFIENNAKGMSNKELTEKFNTYFNLNLEVSQIKSFKGNNKISSGLNGRFRKGQTSWNKGKKRLYESQ